MTDALERADIERFERELRRKQAELEVDIDRLADEASEVAQAGEATPADADVAEREGDVDLRLAKQNDSVLREVLAALERVRAGTYGRCESCGRWVARERLELLPYARQCADCARSDPGGPASPEAPRAL